MEDHSKAYDTFKEMMAAAEIMQKFQRIHNVIRLDYLELLRLTEDNRGSKASFDALYRASMRSFFSLIEADISGLNALDRYEGYDDRHSFMYKLKETYKQIGKTWKKETIQQKYFSTKIKDLTILKKKRDQLVHPKEHAHIHEASESAFAQLKAVFKDYDDFVNALMNNFFVGVKLKMDWASNN
jgi:hypothetical protein